MSSKVAIEITNYSFWFSCSKLRIFPLQIKFYPGYVFVEHQHRYSTHCIYFWRIFLFISWLITTFELYSGLNFSDTKNLVKILYHLHFFVTKTACIPIAFACQTKSEIIAKLLNSIWQNNVSYFIRKPRTSSNTKDKLFVMLLLSSTLGFILFYLLFCPAIAFVLPCLHDTPLLHLLPISCSTGSFRLVIYFVQFAFMLPIAAMYISTAPVLLVALKELNTKLGNLW